MFLGSEVRIMNCPIIFFLYKVGLAMALGGELLYPNFSALMNGEDSLRFIGLAVTSAIYSSSVIPIILAVWLMSDKILMKVDIDHNLYSRNP